MNSLLARILAIMIALCGHIAVNAAEATDDRLIADCEKSMASADYVKAELFATRLKEYGQKVKSDRDIAFADACLGALAVSTGKLQQGLKLLQSANQWGEKEKNDTVIAMALNGLGIHRIMADYNLVIALKYFNKARNHAVAARSPLLRYRIENNVVQVAIIRGDTTMLDYAVACFDEASKLPVRPALPILARHIARLLIIKQDYDKAVRYLDEADRLGSTADKDYIVGVMLRAEIFLRKDDWRHAAETYRRALSLARDVTQQIEAYMGLAKAKFGAGEVNEAKSLAVKAKSLTDKAGITAHDADYFNLMKDISAALGQWPDAYRYADSLNYCIEQQAGAEKEYIQKQITTAMRVEQKEQAAEMRRQELQAEKRRNIILGIALAIVVALSFFLFLEIRNKNRLYKTIVRQFRDAIAEQDKLRSQLRLQDSEVPVPSSPEDSDGDSNALDNDFADTLWRNLTHEMEDNKVYLEQGMTREVLAKMLGTNRTYLSKVICARTGLGYSQFINNYRIDEAVRILSDPARADYPLKAICQDIGFNSMTTFYNLFKVRTGMTPSVFRKNA